MGVNEAKRRGIEPVRKEINKKKAERPFFIDFVNKGGIIFLRAVQSLKKVYQ